LTREELAEIKRREFTKQKIESVFRNSGSSDELFDAFRLAVENRIKDEDLYKILLWNKALSVDELGMYAEKICREFPDISFNVCFDVGKILEATSVYGSNLELALSYFIKATRKEPGSVLPYVAAAALYNKELDLPEFENLINFLKEGLENVDQKSKICFALVDLYKTKDEEEKEKIYRKMGEKYQRSGK
jgi:hypothetical protein